MNLLLSYALVLSNAITLAVVEVYPTLENCDIMAARVRAAISDHSIRVTCWPTTYSDPNQAQKQLRHVANLVT
jgi:predicted regulator of amino acid metabolism with ACT domain